MIYKIIIFYDISDNKTRNTISSFLLNVGFKRIQKSVFFGELNKKEKEELIKKLNKTIKEDSLAIIEICSSCYEKIKKIGEVESFNYPDFLYISQ